MSKIIKFGREAKKELKIGVDAVGDAVNPTIGPKGRNVVYDKGYGGPTITNDGVSIAREIVLKDPMQNMGANLCKEVSQKTNDAAGDGTTTAAILMQAIVSAGMKEINVSFWQAIYRFITLKKVRINAIGVKNGIDKAAQIAVEYLKSIAKPINSDEEITQVATISSESEEIGKMISSTLSKLGKDSVITVEESPTVGITSEVSTGMQFDKGYISHFMVTDQTRMEAECKDVPVLVTDMKIGIFEDILPLLESLVKSGKRELVIIAEDVVGEALNTFVINKLRGGPTILCIKAPGFGLRKVDYLQDIATVVGANFISNEIHNGSFADVKIEDLGTADKVVSTKDKTTIIGGKGTKESVEARIASAKTEITKLESKHDILKVEERIARLSGGVAIIEVESLLSYPLIA